MMQLATISVPEARTLMIKPFDKNALKGIEKAILASDLGLNPNNDGQVIRLILPPLNEERRKELVKRVHHRVEEARVAMRNIRRDSMKELKDYESEKLITEDDRKRGEDDLQKMTDKMMAELDRILHNKEVEIMEV